MWSLSSLLLGILMTTVHSEIYSSIQSIKDAFGTERQIVTEALEFLKILGDENETLAIKQFREFVRTAHSLHVSHEQDEHLTFLHHPSNIYHFVKRCVLDWRRHVIHFPHSKNSTIKAYGMDLRDEVFPRAEYWPKQEDLTAVSLGLIRLQEAYHLDFTELANGKVHGFTADPLTTEDFYDIAMVANENMKPNSAIRWLNETLARLDAGVGGVGAPVIAKAMQSMAEVYSKVGDHRRTLEVSERLLHSDPQSRTFQQLYAYYHERNRTQLSMDLVDPVEATDEAYEKLCRGQQHKSSSGKNLYCFYRSTSIPYYPAKTELVNHNPEIYIIHDIMFREEEKIIKNITTKELERSLTGTRLGLVFSHIDPGRVSRTAWLHIPNELERLRGRVALFTGLTTRLPATSPLEAHEGIQIVNYGIGGMYMPHYDMFTGSGSDQNFTRRPSGDRIATLVLYMDHVDHGGATVFPEIGARVPFVQGAGAFWYNLFKNGTADQRTLHAGCPVNIGSKWIANFWFRFVAQADSRPCSTNKDE